MSCNFCRLRAGRWTTTLSRGISNESMDPGYIATGQGMSIAATAVKTMNGAPANAGGDIGACPYGIAVFQF